MDDLISRQAAIEAVGVNTWAGARIMQLPPANCSEFPNSSDTISRQAAIDSLGERHTVWTTDGERRRIGMRKSVRVIDSSPTANKKGLRIKVESVELDENNNLLALHIDYSGLHERGGGIVEVAQKNKFSLPEV